MAANSTDQIDLIIAGSEPAASVAAIRGRALGLSVVLVRDSESESRRPSSAWLAAPGLRVCSECGLGERDLGKAPFDGISLHSGDLRRSLDVAQDGLSGRLVDYAAFSRALYKRAIEHGARTVDGRVAAVQLGDDALQVSLVDQTALCGSVLIIADGPESTAAAMARMASDAQAQNVPRCFSLTLSNADGQSALSVVLGAGDGTNIGVVSRLGGKAHLELLVRSRADAPAAQFDAFRAAAEAAGLIPDEPNAKPTVLPSPAGVALDMDSHVGKRTLLVGQAGGFVAAFNNDRLYAAMRSGWLAAEAAARAVAADLVQDELATFESAWRTELADYLRMPNTDLSLLMPLVFNENLQMSARVARAFLLGEKF